MQGLKIKCVQCGRISFETTDQFNPEMPPHGGMVRCLLQYHIDWLCVPTTKASEMCCPECLAPLVVGGVLNVVIPAREAGEAFKESPTIDKNTVFDAKCNVCGHKWGYKVNNPGTCPACGESNMELNGETDTTLKVTANDLQVPIRDNSPQAHMDGGKLNVVDPKNIESFAEKGKKFLEEMKEPYGYRCDICGKPCKTELGLNSHKRSHK